MKLLLSIRSNILGMLAFLTISLFAVACVKQGGITLGMLTEEVIQRLGEPDSIAIQEGKLLRKPEEAEGKDFVGKRIVYIYEASGIQVWFENGKVSGMTKNGVSVLSGKSAKRI